MKLSKYNYLWNDLPSDERKRLMPHMLESQILHIEQCKNKAVRSHKALMSEFNEHINNLQIELNKKATIVRTKGE